MKNTVSKIASLFVTLLIVALGAGCDDTFEPFQENELFFSMYGVLDLHADTQWVRIMPIGQTLFTDEPESNNVEVSLTRLSTGETTALNDSVFVFGNDAYVWNYWQPMTLHPNEPYRLTARNEEGNESVAQITMPSVLPVPDVEYDINDEEGSVAATFSDSLIVLDTWYRVQFFSGTSCIQEEVMSFSSVSQITDRANGSFDINISNGIALSRRIGARSHAITERRLVMITASRDWPYLDGLTDEEVALPDIARNVTNGVGLVPGVAKRVVQLSPRTYPCTTEF